MDVMPSILTARRLLFRQQGAVFGLTNQYDVLNPDTDQPLGASREQPPGPWSRLFRHTDFKRMTPFDIRLQDAAGRPVARVTRGIPVLVAEAAIEAPEGQPIGSFRLRPFSISGAFDVLDARRTPVCSLTGNLSGRNFVFTAPNAVALATVTRTWSGMQRELVLGAADYLLEVDPVVPAESLTRRLILAAVLCVGAMIRLET